MSKVCFLLGIMPRCGTNFIENQLRLHPDCSAPGPVWEDFLVSNSSLLNTYIKQVTKHWDKYWFRHSCEDYESQLEKMIGTGLKNFLLSQLNVESEFEYIITKTPTVKGIANFDRYFYDSKLIIIIRDGRSVVASGKKSFDWDFEKSTLDWRNNARKIQSFLHDYPNKAILIKYEDMCVSPKPHLEKICQYLDINFEKYPLDKVDNLPVSGSSDLKKENGQVHWKAVEKGAEFDPLMRFSNWSSWKSKVFNYIAGKEMLNFGYDINNELTVFDRLIIPIYLFTWPIRSIPSILYFALKHKNLIIKTN